jgi:hypothetical protein
LDNDGDANIADEAAKNFKLALQPLYSAESVRWLWECLMDGHTVIRDADL